MNNIDFQYQNLLQDILDNGVEKETRNGKTLSVFGWQIRHKMSQGFPLLTTKKMAINSVMTELKWFLKGRTDIRYLNENGCKIWNGDAYRVYERSYNWETEEPPYDLEGFIQKVMEDDDFNRVWGYLGPIYGSQWRGWNGTGSTGDQIDNLISQLKTNPDSRRLLVSAWNVNDLSYMTLPPCHYSFQVYTRELSLEERFKLANYEWPPKGLPNVGIRNLEEKNIPKRAISLMWNQRSVDTFLGLPFNIASYGMLLHLIAKEVNMVPDELIGNLGDTHLYLEHQQQAILQLSRTPFALPRLNLINSDLLNGEFEYEILDYNSHSSIKAPLIN